MSNPRGSITIGVDIGTTSVKALAVDSDGLVVARSRVAHQVMAPEPDLLRHDARKAWRAGPRKAYADVTAQLGASGNGEVAGLAIASMVPSMTAVGRSGVPTLPGLMYGDIEGRPPEIPEGEEAPDTGLPQLGAMPDAEGFLRWAVREAPEAKGYWPCQAVATHALAGVPAIDSGVTASMGLLHARGKSFRYEAVYPDGRVDILLDVPRYDVNWQNRYDLAEPKRLPAGTLVFERPDVWGKKAMQGKCITFTFVKSRSLVQPGVFEKIRSV